MTSGVLCSNLINLDHSNDYAQLKEKAWIGIYNTPKADHPQKRVQPDQCYFTVQIAGSNFEFSL